MTAGQSTASVPRGTEAARQPGPNVCRVAARTDGNPVDQRTVGQDVHTRALHRLLAERATPSGFDAAHELTPADVDKLLEAARWAPSAGNSQPWSFIVGRRGDAVHRRLVAHLAKSSASWAPCASLLVVNLAHLYVEGTAWQFSEFAHYDLGQAVAHMTLQAHAMGLAVHQVRAFDRGAVAAEFAVPGHWEATTMTAIGKPAVAADGETSRHLRHRHPLDAIRWPTVDELSFDV